MIASFRRWISAFFAGFAQLVFCSTLPAGLLVALGLGILSPWMLVGAAAGCLLGTLAGRLTPGMTRESWAAGLAGFNPAILGIVGAGALAAGRPEAWWLPVAFLACSVLGWAMTGPFNRVGLYPLSAPAYLIALAASLALAPTGAWWWPSADTATFSAFAPWIATACLVAAMSSEAPEAAGWATFSALLAYLLTVELMGLQPSDATGLWGIVAPLSAFASVRLFGKRAAAGTGLGAAAVAAVIWLSWQLSPVAVMVPPLVAPMVIALWLVMILRRRPPPVLMQAAFWTCLAALVRARRNGWPIAVVTGPSRHETVPNEDNAAVAGAGSEAGIANHGDWQTLWRTAHRLRRLAPNLASTPTTRAVQEAVGADVVDLVIAGDAIGQFDGIDRTKRIDAVGRADRLSCLACEKSAPWPPADLWRRMTLHCTCGGMLLPDLRQGALANDRLLKAEFSARSENAPGVLLVLEEPACETPVSRLLVDRVRANGGMIFRIAPAASGARDRAGPERMILGKTALALRVLALLCRLSPKWRHSGKTLDSARTNPGTAL